MAINFMVTFKLIPIIDGIKLFEYLFVIVIGDFANKTHSILFTIVFCNKMSFKVCIRIANSILMDNCVTAPGIFIQCIFSIHTVDNGTGIDTSHKILVGFFVVILIFHSIANTMDKMLLRSSIHISVSILINDCIAASIIVIKLIVLIGMIDILDASVLFDDLVNMAIKIKILNGYFSVYGIICNMNAIVAVIHSIWSMFAVLKLMPPGKAQNQVRTQS